ncbi:hypothetical protein SCLCIDRAFT_1217308 [Scleroderma citrinum Foug A]|uniref:Urease alpha-subunit N-terminal domain-containing protein n=1 Tax=Scleroderma citrinum Foug A TaxID=1036808 RepID=A0A0C3A5Q8_9AGAM|nr:hypothetical protein SCLCIDRAFT_1217308 [Scleroderma citrinum Foug A]
MGWDRQQPSKDCKGALDLIITNAVVVDWTGIYKADIGIRNGIIVGTGKLVTRMTWTASIPAWS